MRARMATILACVLLVSAPALGDEVAAAEVALDEEIGGRADALDALRARRIAESRRLMYALVAFGAASTAAGVGLCVPGDHDQALRVAGGVTAGFGVVNVILAATSLRGLAGDEREWAAGRAGRRTRAGLARALLERAAAEQAEAQIFAVNLGLDFAYVSAGLVAVAASQLGVDHPDRWLAGGIAAAAQGVFLVGLDLAGWSFARRAAGRHLLDVTPVVSAIPEGGGARLVLGLAGVY